MRILVACEESQAVTKELRRLGHEAYSCDIEPCSGGHPEWHVQSDAIPILGGWTCIKTADDTHHEIWGRWDMIIAFPPCTHLAVSGAAWFEQKRKDGRQQQGIDFFMKFANADCDCIAIENPIGIMSTHWRKPDQIIHPWQFGHPEKKSTCLWLKGLPPLQPTKDVSEYMKTLPKNKQERLHYLPPSSDRSKLRSKTFPGIARAMAEQWAGQAQIENAPTEAATTVRAWKNNHHHFTHEKGACQVYRQCPDHPDITTALATGYPKPYKPLLCGTCKDEISSHEIHGEWDGRIICTDCIEDEWKELTAREKFVALGYNTKFNG